MKHGIQKIIAEFKEIAVHGKIQLDIGNTCAKPVKRLLHLFSEVDDTRVEARVLYGLGELLFSAFIAIMAGADTFVLIEQYCEGKIKQLRRFTPLENGVPSHDTYRRVFSLLDPESLQKATVSYLLDNIKLMRRAFGIDQEGLRHLCVDGKTANGSGRFTDTPHELKKLHTLHVYDNTNGICLVSKVVGDKTNEIPETQEVLKHLDLKDTVVTFDAMNTQKETISVIVKQKGQYLGSLKANQPTFLEEVASYFTPARLQRIQKSKANYISYTEKAHNCVETRSYWFTRNVDWLLQAEEWPNLRSIIRYEKKSTNIKTDKQSTEVHYYISSLLDADDCADSIRGHWGVENLLHWHLDVTFNEDRCTISDRKAFQNVSLMNKLALSLLKLAAPILKVSVRSSRHFAAWGIEDVLKILCAFDDETLNNAMTNVNPLAGKKGRLTIPEDY